MTTAERIHEQVQRLPEPLQAEALDFIEFLMQRQSMRKEDSDWTRFSLATAMRDIENEDVPIYDESDLKERWV
ncbi:DUF2281 domain-containing protein [Candidatus Poribacteria bacterium]|nr:DUF2281 domain-containing protein [Candidatus Poribacteria bacterium]